MAGLMDSEIYLVWDQWWGKKELHMVSYMARGSAKDLHYFQVVSPTESPKIMGLRGIHSLSSQASRQSLVLPLVLEGGAK